MAKIGYLGAPDDHRDNLVRLLRASGNTPSLLQDSLSRGVYLETPGLLSWGPLGRLWRMGHRASSQVAGTRAPKYLAELLARLDDEGIECLLAYWGSRPFGDLLAIKHHRPEVKLILNVLCHPLGLSRGKIAVQNWLFRRVVRRCDGVIASSRAMEEYLSKTVLRGRSVASLVWPPCLSGELHPRTRRPPCPNVPNVLFLGRLDIARSQPCDNVVTLLKELMDRGIHVYHHRSPEVAIAHAHGHAFDYMSLPDALTFATQFDASLVVYNLEACRRTDRFETTVPDRLIASVAAGIPVAIPRQGYRASREYLANYGGTLEFQSVEDLAARLKDRGSLDALKRNALRDRERYVGESHVDALMGFIGEVTSRRSAGAGAPAPSSGLRTGVRA